jgi:hypothetical protein
VLRWRGGSVERVGLGRLVVVPREVLVGEVSCVLVRLATGSDSIPKREGFWSSRPLCRFVMNSMAVVLRLSSYSQVVRCAGSTREECCLVGIDHVCVHMLMVTRMLESGDAPEAEVARSWQSVLPFMLSLSPCH